jgi:hypothetical protein
VSRVLQMATVLAMAAALSDPVLCDDTRPAKAQPAEPEPEPRPRPSYTDPAHDAAVARIIAERRARKAANFSRRQPKG